MTTSLMLGDLLTGRRWQEVPFTKVSWEQRRNAPEVVKATVNLADPDVRALNLRNTATYGKTFIAVREGDVFLGAGEMGRPDYDADALHLNLGGRGIWDFLGGRTILPLAALSVDTEDFLIPDPLEPTRTIPNPDLGTYLSGYEYGSIVKLWIEQAMTWPGGDIPIVLPSTLAGAHERNIEGIEMKSLGGAISDITRLQGGPDIAFPARWQTDRLGIEWVLQHGTDAQPKLQATAIHRWDLSTEGSNTRGLKTSPMGTPFGALGWQVGGRSADSALVERSYDPTLTYAGFPLRELVDTSHTDVSERATLAGYAGASTDAGQRTPEVWTFEVRKDVAPRLGEYNVGDRCTLIVKGDPLIPDSPPGGYLREIAGLSGDESDWVTVTTTEV